MPDHVEGPKTVKIIGSPNPGLTASNKDPVEEELKRWAQELRNHRGKGNDELDPDPKSWRRYVQHLKSFIFREANF